MWKKIVIMLAVLSFTACKGQDKEVSKDIKSVEINEKITQNPPKGKWEVHKELDEDGKIVRYDSIYSWSSSESNSEMSSMNIDSLMRSHQSYIRKRFSAMENQNFPYLFQKDSLFSKVFFEEDLFMNHFGKDFPEIDKLNERMGKMRKEILQEFSPKTLSEVEIDTDSNN